MSNRNLAFPCGLLTAFIALYKKSPCLWNRKCLAFKNKQKRNEAISRLTELVRKHDPTATKVHVLRKIESMRACVRREHKKVQASIARAKCQDDVYVPHLWYYESLSFVFTDDVQDKTKIEFEADDDAVESDDPDISEDTFESPTQSYCDYAISSNVIDEVPESQVTKPQNDEDIKRKQHCTEVDDEYDAIGINVAAKLRGLPPNMRILAEKLIYDVLFQAQTNVLTPTTVLTLTDPFE